MRDSRPRLRLSGFGLAALAFVLTRLFVAETVQSNVDVFVITALIPLVGGLGLTIFGVALAVGAVPRAYARTVWEWSVLGTFAMLLVIVATALHSIMLGERLGTLWNQSGLLISNVLLGGAILGAIVGDRSARSRQRNEQLVQYAERAMLVNRLLRHEIRNVVAVVTGYAETGRRTTDEATDAIRESAEQIDHTVDHVGKFAATTGELTAVEIGSAVESVLDALPDDADVTVDGTIPEDVLVRADDRLGLLVAELLENAIEHTDSDATVAIDVVVNARTVELTVRDDGPGLPEPATDVLAARSLPQYDDPTFGYGLQMVRLLVEQYDGAIQALCEDGTTMTVTLQRTREGSTPPLALGVPVIDLARVTVAAVLAGIVMGSLLELLGGVVPDVGALYGVRSAAVGWTSHLFHSVVFGLLFAAGCLLSPLDEVASSWRGTTALGVAWGVILWLVAAAVIMPIWLGAVGENATVPNLTAVGFLSHAVWGASLGALYAVLPDSDALPDLDRLRE